MKSFYFLFVLLINGVLFGQSILDSTTFSKNFAMVIDTEGPGFFTMKTSNGTYEFEHFDGQKQIVATQAHSTGLTVANTSFCGVYLYPNTTHCLIVSKNRVNPLSPIGNNGYYAYSFLRYDYAAHQTLTFKVDTFHIVEGALTPHKSDEMYVFHAERDNHYAAFQIKGYILDTNLNLRLINADVQSDFANYGIMDLCHMHSDGNQALTFTIAGPGAYQTEVFDQDLNKLFEENTLTYANDGTSQPILYQKLNADSVLIFNQHRNSAFKFIWELSWWKSPTQGIQDTVFEAPEYQLNEYYGHTYTTSARHVVLDTIGRQIIILATRGNQQENLTENQHIYYYDYDFNLICEDSLVLPDVFNRFCTTTIDNAVYLSQYNDTAVLYHPLSCGGLSPQTPPQPQAVDSTVQSTLTIFPNPSNGIFMVANPEQKATQLRVLSNLGIELLFVVSEQSEISIDLSAYPGGIYFLESEQDGQLSLQTLMLE
jgi:hypothetical protein